MRIGEMLFQHMSHLLHVSVIRVLGIKELSAANISKNSIRMTINAFFLIPRNEENLAAEQAGQFCKKLACRIVRVSLNNFVYHNNSIIALDYVSTINDYICFYHLRFTTYNSTSNIRCIFCQCISIFWI